MEASGDSSTGKGLGSTELFGEGRGKATRTKKSNEMGRTVQVSSPTGFGLADGIATSAPSLGGT